MTRLIVSSEQEALLIRELAELGARLEPSEFEIAAARSRLSAHAWTVRSRPRRGWIATGLVVFLGGAAFAFNAVQEARPAGEGEPTRSAAKSAVPTPSGQGNVGQLPARSVADGDEMATPAENASTALPLDSLPVRGPEDARGPDWNAVADALRSGDETRAERELRRLAAAGGAERESAELALAQLWIRTGKADQAQAMLRRLASHAVDAVVRARAQAMLENFVSSADKEVPP